MQINEEQPFENAVKMRVLDVQLRTVRFRAKRKFFVFLCFGEIHRGSEFLISAFSNEKLDFVEP